MSSQHWQIWQYDIYCYTTYSLNVYLSSIYIKGWYLSVVNEEMNGKDVWYNIWYETLQVGQII